MLVCAASVDENLPAPYLLVRCQPALEQAARQTADYRFDAATPLNCCATSCVVFSQTRKGNSYITGAPPSGNKTATRLLCEIKILPLSSRSTVPRRRFKVSVRRGRTA